MRAIQAILTPQEHLERNREIQRVVNKLLPSGYRFWLLRDLTALVYRRYPDRHACVAQLKISDNRGVWVAINEINKHMAYIAAATDCGRPASKRGYGPEFVLSMKNLNG